MGLGVNGVRFLCFLRRNNQINFDDTLMLGRQELMLKNRDISRINSDYSDVLIKELAQEKYSENFFYRLGAKRVYSMDVSNYERVSYIHDLNIDVPDELHCKFSTIIDGGTTEHIYNYPVAIKNIMAMLNWGGWYVGMIPMNNWSGHGFYQFSPSLFIQIFANVNGFELEYLCLERKYHDKKLYRIREMDLNKRIEINEALPTLLYVVAKKIGHTPRKLEIQEESYEQIWSGKIIANDKLKEFMISVLIKTPRCIQFLIDKYRTYKKLSYLEVLRI